MMIERDLRAPSPARYVVAAALSALCLLGCGSDEEGSPRDKAIADVKAYVSSNLDDLVASTSALCAAAPAADADGWNATADASAISTMKDSWRKARVAYEHVEGAIAVLFPELDVATDERYDGFLTELGPDDNLFDDQGVTGIHAVERILWSDAPRAEVVAFEKEIKGYKVAAFPANMAEAGDFKSKLCNRLVVDSTKMRDQFKPLALEPATAYRGVIGSMEEQLEKITLAASGEEESRYADETLADMRANVEGGKATHAAFRAWLRESKDGPAIDDAYAANAGRKLPPVPPSWSSVTPSTADLMTPFGQLYTLLKKESDPEAAGTVVNDMGKAAEAMGIPVLPE
jgi:iron uptake system component EfeO